jgi:predicted enzyme related to lactoylglutathione lyase
MAIRGVKQVAINAKDLKRAIAFYRDVLGLELLFEAPPQMAFFDCGGVRLMVGVASAPEFDHPASVLYYDVNDIEAEHARLTRQGVAFRSPVHKVARVGDRDLYLAFFPDSEGNLCALSEERR